MILYDKLFWSVASNAYLFILGILFILRYYKYDPKKDNQENPLAEMNVVSINYKYIIKGKPFRGIMMFFGMIMVALSLLFSIGILFHHWETGAVFFDDILNSIKTGNETGAFGKGLIAFVFLVPLLFAFVLFLIGYLYSRFIHSKFFGDLEKQMKKNFHEDIK